jgi:hypothetical protein
MRTVLPPPYGLRRVKVVLLVFLVALFAVDFSTLAPPAAVSQGAALVWPPNGWALDTLTPTLRWAGSGYTHLFVQRVGAQSPTIDTVLGPGIDQHAPLSPLAAGATYRWRIRSNPLSPSQSPFSWSQWTPEWTFSTPARPASWSASAQVAPLGPASGSLVEQVNPMLSFRLPPGAQQVEIMLIPASNPSGGVSIVQPAATEIALPAPPHWYWMLPGTTYYWRVRASNQAGDLPREHPSWTPWSDTWSFRTPMPGGESVYPLQPAPHAVADSLLPTLVWGDTTGTNFYYEIQLSRDPNFVTDPLAARAMVYWEVRHGGFSSPRNSYTVPSGYPLTPGVTYYWRVRPRSGDNPASVGWSKTWSFITPGATGSARVAEAVGVVGSGGAAPGLPPGP